MRDSTGIKVLGDGEWQARKHGIQGCRQWRKVHLAMDTATSDVRAVEFTPSRDGDSPVLPDLLGQIPKDEPIGTVTAPSRQIASQSPAGQWMELVTPADAMPPSSGARLFRSFRSERTGDPGRRTARRHGPEMKPCAPHDITAGRVSEALERIPCSQPDRGEDALPQILRGAHREPRDPDRQTTEPHIRVALMNCFSALGTPEIIRVA